MTARINTAERLRRRDVRLRRRPTVEIAPRFRSTDTPTSQQRAALIAARDGGPLARQRYGLWTNTASKTDITTQTIMACCVRGWLADAPGYEMAMRPSWTPVVITDAGLAALSKGE